MTTESKTTDSNTKQLSPTRIYVASLADYNAGRLHGEWIDANQPADDIHASIQQMLNESEEDIAEDWAIHDYEGFGSLRLSEYESIETVADIAHSIAVHGGVFAELLNHFGGTNSLDEARAAMENNYQGCWPSIKDYAEDSFADVIGNELKTLPSVIQFAIDWDVVAKELELSGDIYAIEYDHEFHIFFS